MPLSSMTGTIVRELGLRRLIQGESTSWTLPVEPLDLERSFIVPDSLIRLQSTTNSQHAWLQDPYLL